MFNSNVLEVVMGMIACFASISLIASSLQEALASIFRLRARTLLSGIDELLNGQSLVVDIYNHALVNPRSDGRAISVATISRKMAPSYIDPVNFARALIDSLHKNAPRVTDMPNRLNTITDPQLRQCLCCLYARSSTGVTSFESAIAQWFDSSMDRISGSYKRWAQLWTFVFALFVAVVLNIDAYRVMTSLWAISTHSMLHITPPVPGEGIHGALSSLEQLPIGWNRDQSYGCDYIAGAIPGWIIAATSALFGAPFWFGILGKVAELRGSGDKPKVA
jgi:hypothetical protein